MNPNPYNVAPQYAPRPYPNAAPVAPQYPEDGNVVAEASKCFGILSLFFTFIVGIIFGIFALKNSALSVQMLGKWTPTAKAGKIYGLVGLIVSSVITLAALIVAIAIIAEEL